jgi:hypothetical protein
MPFCESRLGDFWPAQVATDAVAADIILWDTRTLADVPLSHGAEGQRMGVAASLRSSACAVSSRFGNACPLWVDGVEKGLVIIGEP